MQSRNDALAADNAKLSRAVAAAEKIATEATAQIKNPEFLKAAIAQALGIGVEKDPTVAFAEVQQRLSVTEQRAKAAVLRAAATDVLAAAEAKRVGHVLKLLADDFRNVAVDLETDQVDVAAITQHVTKFKAENPDYFRQPATSQPADKGPPLQGSRLPVPGQPVPAPGPALGLTAAEAWTLPLDEVRRRRLNTTQQV